jgi:hypothetical protein
MDRTTEMLDLWCSAPDVEFIHEGAEEAYKRRAGRVADAIQLKLPDRVPVVPSFGMFPAFDNGYTSEEVMFDHEKAHKAWMKTLADFEPDLFRGSGYAFSGHVLEALDYRQLKLPGRGIPAKHIYQFLEREYVRAEEFYDHFVEDPSDFMLRTYLPRACGILEPMRTLPPLTTWFGYYLSILTNASFFGQPEVVEALESLMRAGAAALTWNRRLAEEAKQIRSLGYPSMAGGGTAAPFDIIGDWFRGTKGIMLDMYRMPEKLLAAMEKLVPILVKMGAEQAKKNGNPIVGLMLHKGSDGFMSPEQFKVFYWPSLRKVMTALIEEGCVPMPLFEGRYTSRLEIIKDIPKAKAIYWFEQVDIHKAKEILGDRVCFRGNVPASLLHSGTPLQVKNYVKTLIDVVGRDGGLMVDCGIWFDEAKHENVKTMVDFTKEYGVYR